MFAGGCEENENEPITTAKKEGLRQLTTAQSSSLTFNSIASCARRGTSTAYDVSNHWGVQEVEEQNNRLVYGDCGTIFTPFRSFRLNE